MLTIYEFLENTCDFIVPEMCQAEETNVFDLFKQMLQDAKMPDVEIVCIYSNEATCKVVSMDKKTYIIWDMHYWQLITDYVALVESYVNGEVEYAREYYNFILYSAITHRMENERAKKVLCEVVERIRENLLCNYKEDLERKQKIAHKIYFLKYMAFCHEIWHIKSKLYPEVFSNIRDFLTGHYKDVLLSLKNKLYTFEEKCIEKNYMQMSFEESLEEYVNNETILEEIICDAYSFANCVIAFPELNIDNSNDFVADMRGLRSAIISFSDDVMSYEKFITQCCSTNTIITEETMLKFRPSLINDSNAHIARVQVCDLFILIVLYHKGKLDNVWMSKYSDIYNPLHGFSPRMKTLKEVFERYNDTLLNEQ